MLLTDTIKPSCLEMPASVPALPSVGFKEGLISLGLSFHIYLMEINLS
jgi:hypothetical protein